MQVVCIFKNKDHAWTAQHLFAESLISFFGPKVEHLAGEGNGTPLQYSCLENSMGGGAWWAAVHGVAKSRTRLSDFTFIFHFHALEKEMATHSSVLAWRIPGMGDPGGLPPMGSHRVRHDWSDLAAVAEHLAWPNQSVPDSPDPKWLLIWFPYSKGDQTKVVISWFVYRWHITQFKSMHYNKTG